MAPRLPWFALLVAFAFSGCAYGYAGKEGKRRSEREYKPRVKVVTIKESPDDEDPKPDEDKPDKPDKPDAVTSPCGTPTFEIFYYSGSTQVTKTVDCLRRSIVDVKRTPIGESAYSEAQSAGLPEGSWYLLVDPKGGRGDFLNNAQLLKLSREFSIEYYGHDTSRDLLVYLYQQEDVQ